MVEWMDGILGMLLWVISLGLMGFFFRNDKKTASE